MRRCCIAESAQTGRERGDKEIWIVYSEIRIVKSLEALQLLWHHFLKVKIFAGQKGSFFLLNCRNKGRKSERSDHSCAKALISFYDFVKFGFVFTLDAKLLKLSWSKMGMLLWCLISLPQSSIFSHECASYCDVNDDLPTFCLDSPQPSMIRWSLCASPLDGHKKEKNCHCIAEWMKRNEKIKSFH